MTNLKKKEQTQSEAQSSQNSNIVPSTEATHGEANQKTQTCPALYPSQPNTSNK